MGELLQAAFTIKRGFFFKKRVGKEKRKSARGDGEKKRKKNVTYDREVSRDWRAKLNEFWFLVFWSILCQLDVFFF